MADKIYRVRIEAYDPETETSEVLLEENEDGGYSGLLFLGETCDGNLRSAMQHLRLSDVAAMFSMDEDLTRAARMVTMRKSIELLTRSDDECPQ